MNRGAKRALGAVAAAIAVLLLSVTIWIKVNSRDIPAPDISDLIPARSEVADEENACTYIARAFEMLRWPKDERKIDAICEGETWDGTFVADLVSSNAEAMALIKQALACKFYQPDEASARKGIRPFMQCFSLSKLMTLGCMHDRGAGQIERAWEGCIHMLDFGSLIASQPSDFMDFPVGMRTIERSLDQAWRLLDDPNTDGAQLIRLSDRLDRMTILDTGLVQAFQVEFQFIAGLIDRFDSQTARKPLGRYVFQPNRTKAKFAQFCRAMIQKIPQCYADMDLPKSDPDRYSKVQRLVSRLRPNARARLSLPAPDYINGVFAGRCKVQSRLDGLRLVVACRLYEGRQGRLPDTLDDLVPALLKEVPRDPFDGEPFRYLPERALVYSVGMDLKDSHGTAPRGFSRYRPGVPSNAGDLVYPIHPDTE